MSVDVSPAPEKRKVRMSKSSRGRSKVKLSRSLGIVLTPKAAKYFEKRPYPPGDHGRNRRKETEYAIRLREKQRLRAQYGIREAQLKIAIETAQKKSGKTGDLLIQLLETRLDALVLRSGFARTIAQARQLVVHRHIGVNGERVDKPSFRVAEGDNIHVLKTSRNLDLFVVAAAGGHAQVLPDVPAYLEVNLDALRSKLVRLPERSEVPIECDVQLVVEFYAGK